jgi:hypothetical protein
MGEGPGIDVPPLEIEVTCYAGHRGEETPRSFRLAGATVEVVEVLDRWLAPDHRYFKVLGPGGDTFILRHGVALDRWELTFFGRAGRRGEPALPSGG